MSRSRQSSVSHVAKRSIKRGQRSDRVIQQHGSDLDKTAPSEWGKMGEEWVVEIAEQFETSFFWSIAFFMVILKTGKVAQEEHGALGSLCFKMEDSRECRFVMRTVSREEG